MYTYSLLAEAPFALPADSPCVRDATPRRYTVPRSSQSQGTPCGLWHPYGAACATARFEHTRVRCSPNIARADCRAASLFSRSAYFLTSSLAPQSAPASRPEAEEGEARAANTGTSQKGKVGLRGRGWGRDLQCGDAAWSSSCQGSSWPSTWAARGRSTQAPCARAATTSLRPAPQDANRHLVKWQ
jgi:hypothetical protein